MNIPISLETLADILRHHGYEVSKPAETAPKTEDELIFDALQAGWWAAGGRNATDGPVAMLQALAAHGFTIARKP